MSPPRVAKRPLEGLVVGGVAVRRGTSVRVDLPVSGLPVGPEVTLPCMVVRGGKDGPRIWLSAAIHGDELNGIEIISRVLDQLSARTLNGTILAVPTVNVFGLLHEDRYLPDRRDLNRSFPGGSGGSLARRLAGTLISQVVEGCSFGIDLHTGSDDRENLPQIRCDLDDAETRRLGEAFGAPVLVHGRTRDGSLRAAAADRGVRVLVYEGGQALRFDEGAIRQGVAGVLGVLRELGMWHGEAPGRTKSLLCRRSSWERASRAGFARMTVGLGERVEAGQQLGYVGGPFGGRRRALKAKHGGVVIGIARNPVVYQGDAVVHIGRIEGEPEAAEPLVAEVEAPGR